MKRVLIVAADGLTKSGVPNVFINIIRNMSNKGYVFDVLYFDEKDAFYKKEIESFGGKAIYSPIDSLKTSKLRKLAVKLSYKKELLKVFKQYGPYYCVHSFKGFESGYILKAAKKADIKNRISHMTFYYNKPDSFLVRLIENREMRLVEKYSTYVISDSERTSKNNLPKSKKSLVINNYVDDKSFRFVDLANEAREISFIQIGSYCGNKNQLFSLELLKRIIKKYPHSLLNFVGFRNPDEVNYLDKIKKEVEVNGLTNNVAFYEHDANTQELFEKCHYLLFPSHSESFGIVVVEAQLSGLSCFCSDTISKEGNCGGCSYLPLLDLDLWFKEICSSFEKDGGKHKQYDCSKFDRINITSEYLSIYEGELKLDK